MPISPSCFSAEVIPIRNVYYTPPSTLSSSEAVPIRNKNYVPSSTPDIISVTTNLNDAPMPSPRPATNYAIESLYSIGDALIQEDTSLTVLEEYEEEEGGDQENIFRNYEISQEVRQQGCSQTSDPKHTKGMLSNEWYDILILTSLSHMAHLH